MHGATGPNEPDRAAGLDAGCAPASSPQPTFGTRPMSGRLGRALARAGRAALDLVLPPQCPVCGVLVGNPGLCAACWRAMPWIERPYCERLGIPFAFESGSQLSPAALADPPAYGRARAAARFEGPAQALVHALKYRSREELARVMGPWMARAGRELLAQSDVLVPVPLHWTRLWRRGFNQSAVLAREVSRASGVPVALDALARARRTPSQIGLTSSARRRNVAGAFRVRPERRIDIEGRAVLLVDDVVTSGATVEACTRTLLRAGAARVDVLAFARVVA
jgi:ComF family protein